VNTAFYEPSQKTKEQSIYALSRPIPSIKIQGQWLEQAGFAIDQPVKIRVIDGCLVFTTDLKGRRIGALCVRIVVIT